MIKLLGIVFLLPICLFAGTAKDLLIPAQNLISKSQKIQNLRSKYGFLLKHPKYQLHSEIETVQFDQLYIENTQEIHRKEWRVIGGDVKVHYYKNSQKYILNDHLYNFKINFKSVDLVPIDIIKNQISKHLHLSYSLSSNQYRIHYKLLPVSATELLPVYWITTKTTPEKAATTLVVNAKTSELIYNFSQIHNLNSEIPGMKTYDGRSHILKSNKPEYKFLIDNKKYQYVCQIISSNKDSLGEPLLIHIDRCETGLDSSALRAEKNISTILKYYLLNHSQYGFDNDQQKKTIIKSLVHAGEKFDNAYWDEDLEIMVYGDGSGGADRNSTNDYTLALDIAGHEFTHAIVSHTANFMTPTESGALNEAFADIFGILISRSQNKYANWNIGAKLYNNLDGDSDEIALRSLSNPSKFKTSAVINGKSEMVSFPEKYSERLAQNQQCNEDNDQCEIHANSTIWSHTAYLINQSYQDKLGYTSEVADQKTSLLYFLTLTHKLRENETFKTAAIALLNTCHELTADQKVTESECVIVKESLIQTELM